VNETVIRLAARGDGVTDAGQFFKGTAPGDIIEANGSVIAGPHRAIPPCRHYAVCGGCQLQHVDDASYAGFVAERIMRALAEHRVDAPTFAPVHLSAPHTRRRATLRAERRGKKVILGFNEGAGYSHTDPCRSGNRSAACRFRAGWIDGHRSAQRFRPNARVGEVVA